MKLPESTPPAPEPSENSETHPKAEPLPVTVNEQTEIRERIAEAMKSERKHVKYPGGAWRKNL